MNSRSSPIGLIAVTNNDKWIVINDIKYKVIINFIDMVYEKYDNT